MHLPIPSPREAGEVTDRMGPLLGPGDPDCDRLREWPGQVHECPGPGCTYPLRVPPLPHTAPEED
jgi:hypothetical protein